MGIIQETMNGKRVYKSEKQEYKHLFEKVGRNGKWITIKEK